MPRSRFLTLLLALAAAWALLRDVRGQAPAGEVTYVGRRQFWIPFTPGPAEQRIREVRLFVSTDQGRRWESFAAAPPEQRRFHFTAAADGLYWFATQTLDVDGKRNPPTMDGAAPTLKVVVDTIPPSVQLRPLPARDGEVGVSWEIRDEYLDLSQPNAVLLEYRTAGGVWSPLLRRQAGSQMYWVPEGNGELEVRLRARDRAGNWGEGTTRVALAGGGQAPPAAQPSPAGGVEPDPARRLVNSRTISLGYEIKDKGPSGISAIELWYTQDGRGWSRFPLPKGTDNNFQPPLVFSVDGEGVYGFTMIAKSGVGTLGERPPQIGDAPQVWVEVDLTRPDVKLGQVVVGQGPDKGKLLITWTAHDKNLEKEPITLSYAEQAAGPWTPITPARIANTGRHVWTMPQQLPFQFYVKVEAIDRARNVGESITSETVKVDLSQPRVKILDVGAAGK